jgi:hypothetical protein
MIKYAPHAHGSNPGRPLEYAAGAQEVEFGYFPARMLGMKVFDGSEFTARWIMALRLHIIQI